MRKRDRMINRCYTTGRCIRERFIFSPSRPSIGWLAFVLSLTFKQPAIWTALGKQCFFFFFACKYQVSNLGSNLVAGPRIYSGSDDFQVSGFQLSWFFTVLFPRLRLRQLWLLTHALWAKYLHYFKTNSHHNSVPPANCHVFENRWFFFFFSFLPWKFYIST